MATPIKGGLPPDMHLPAGYRLRLRALDPTTFADVANVTIDEISFLVTDLFDVQTQPGVDGNAPPPLLVPSDDIA